jgi:hypothetical protein
MIRVLHNHPDAVRCACNLSVDAVGAILNGRAPDGRAWTERGSPPSSPPDLRQTADRRKSCPRSLAFSDVREDCTVISGTRRPSCRAPPHGNQVSRTSTRDRTASATRPADFDDDGELRPAPVRCSLWPGGRTAKPRRWRYGDSAISSTRLAFSACWSARCFTDRS